MRRTEIYVKAMIAWLETTAPHKARQRSLVCCVKNPDREGYRHNEAAIAAEYFNHLSFPELSCSSRCPGAALFGRFRVARPRRRRVSAAGHQSS